MKTKQKHVCSGGEKKSLHANEEPKQSLTHMQTHFGFGGTSHTKHPVFLIQFGSPTLFSKHTTGKKKKNPNFIIIHAALAPNPTVQFISSAKTIPPPTHKTKQNQKKADNAMKIFSSHNSQVTLSHSVRQKEDENKTCLSDSNTGN